LEGATEKLIKDTKAFTEAVTGVCCSHFENPLNLTRPHSPLLIWRWVF
jgi:hypothetical protein